nr:uncharacterized protein LOC121121074 [Lepeophtheirus salmonis]XP_040571876.1 uncharacterized protein LOC121121074 [Lepeophtheirus salmonis]
MVHLVKSQRGGMKLVDDKNYIYRVDRKYGFKVYWKCERDKCKSRLHTITKENDSLNISVCSRVGEHDHPNKPSKPPKPKVSAKKRKVKSVTLSSRILTGEMPSSDMDETPLSLMSNSVNLDDSINNLKQKENRIPAIPIGRCGYPIPLDYLFLDNGEQFLLYDSGQYDPDRILIFGSQVALEDLTSNTDWAFDGSFNCSSEMYFQLFTLHIIIGHVSVPRLFVLLPNRSDATYNRLFTALKKLNSSFNPETLMIDFEKTNLNAFSAKFPLKNITGCLFHMTKNLYQHIENIGLKLRYSTDGDFNMKIKCFSALAFLPIPDVIDGYIDLADDDDLPQEFVSYFETHYIGGLRGHGERRRRVKPTFPIELWNVYSKQISDVIKTKNSVEEFHNALQSSITNMHPNLWKLIDYLKKEEESVMEKRRELESIDVKQIKEVHENLIIRLEQVMAEYDSSQKIQYLKAISCNLHSF